MMLRSGGKIKKILVVFGTRPEVIKMAPLIHELKKRKNYFNLIICGTGQHREMLKSHLEVFRIFPDIDLDLMRKNQNLSQIMGLTLLKLTDEINKLRPDIVLVHGDTTSTFSAALAAFNCRVPVGHIEAGMRTYNINSPFPEEFNRQIVSKIATFHFAPTKHCESNLLKERIPQEKIFVTGNTIVDSINMQLFNLNKDQSLKNSIHNNLTKILNFDWINDKFILITGHRRENFGEKFIQICEAIREISLIYPKVHFVYPVHLNPNVQNPVSKILSGIKNIHLIDPQGYNEFLTLLKHCYFILTDSGGIQEEAPSLGKPLLLMRENTERPESIEAGCSILVGSSKSEIIEKTSAMLNRVEDYEKMILKNNPYGDGNASQRIADIIQSSKLEAEL